ncbi:MAG: hypothetical protein HUU20_23420, partial [Pirellulales bacterium]|nr:hypothetical protein [Pirellulales bacterium]
SALLGVVCLSAGWFFGTAAFSATRADRRAASQLVEGALQQELHGSDSLRGELLQAALRRSPDHAPARWHAGYVRVENHWLKFDDLSGVSASDRWLETYRKLRDEYPDSVEGHLALARWCAQRSLEDQARAHRTRILEMDPDNAEARGALGHRRVGKAWLTPEEIRQTAAAAQQTAEGFKRWAPEIQRIAGGLSDRKAVCREQASRQLLAIDDPAAVAAIEQILAAHSEEAALLAVRALAGIESHEGSLALARQAVFSAWNTVRETATQALVAKKLDDYVPPLLAAMSTKIRTRLQAYAAPGGQFIVREEFYREGQNLGYYRVIETEYNRPQNGGRLQQSDAGMVLPHAAATVSNRQAVMQRQNDVIERLNARVCELLAAVTGRQLPADPEAWWQWWNDLNEVYADGSKPVEEDYEQNEVPVVTPSPVVAGTLDCLAAGTPVWTDAGMRPVEQIRVGDRVLSQDADSGELAYKPVLRTTLRPAGPLTRITVGERALRSSGGHTFWVAGRGWVKARELETGAVLHGVAGTASVGTVEMAGYEPTYNLVVADFHTYFVGEARILSHDNTVRRPTNAVVPGLTRP